MAGLSSLHSENELMCEENRIIRLEAFASHSIKNRNRVAIRDRRDPKEEIMFHVV